MEIIIHRVNLLKKLIKLKFIPNAVMTSEKYANRWSNLFNLYK